jgi:threonine dehydratase
MTISFQDIKDAQARLSGHIQHTPIVTSSLLNAWLGHRVLFKAECLQTTGSFKLRGATNFVQHALAQHSLPDYIVANSSGNHAQAVAYAGGHAGRDVTIFSTDNIASVKAQATKEYGADLYLYPTRLEADEAVAAAASEDNVVWIPPFNHADIIAGQGTATCEAIQQLQQQQISPDAIFAPCGGGGLLSGAVVAARELTPQAQVIGVEPQAANDASLSLQQGHIVQLTKPPVTLADGAATPAVGELTFPLLQQLDGFYEADEIQIAYWTQWLQHLLKLHIEPTCCMTMSGVAAWLSEQTTQQTVLVILSGGNISPQSMQRIYATDYLQQPPAL